MPSTDSETMKPAGEVDKKFDRRKLHESSEYHPDLQPERRNTTKPYIVQQPEGPSFQVKGNVIDWEKWRFRVGFNYVSRELTAYGVYGAGLNALQREGLTLHDITYDGRSVFYRLSLSEMFVPYGDSRAPYPRKGAFDLGKVFLDPLRMDVADKRHV